MSDFSDDSDGSDSDMDGMRSPLASLDTLCESGLNVRTVTVTRPEGSGQIFKSLGIQISNTESDLIGSAKISAVDQDTLAKWLLEGEISVGDLIVSIGDEYLLGSSFSTAMMAIAECGHGDSTSISMKLTSINELKSKGMFTPRATSSVLSDDDDDDDDDVDDDDDDDDADNDNTDQAVTLQKSKDFEANITAADEPLTNTTTSENAELSHSTTAMDKNKDTQNEDKPDNVITPTSSPPSSPTPQPDSESISHTPTAPTQHDNDDGGAPPHDDDIEMGTLEGLNEPTVKVYDDEPLVVTQKKTKKKKKKRGKTREDQLASSTKKLGKPKSATVVALDEAPPPPPPPIEIDPLERAKATEIEVNMLAAKTEESVAKAKRSKSTDEWKSMNAALNRQLKLSEDNDDDETSDELKAPKPKKEAKAALPSWLKQVPLRFVQLKRDAGGLGFQIQREGKSKCIRVVDVKPNSAADVAGLLRNDVLVYVGNACVLGKSIQVAGAAIVSQKDNITFTVASGEEFDRVEPDENDLGFFDDKDERVTIVEPVLAPPPPDPAVAELSAVLSEETLYEKCLDSLDFKEVRIIKCANDKGIGLRVFSASSTWACPNPRGIRIAKVFENSPAARAGGLEVGDVILKVNGVLAIDAKHQAVVSLIQAAQIAIPPGQFFPGQVATLKDFQMPEDKGGKDLTGEIVTYVRFDPSNAQCHHIVELKAGEHIAVAGRSLSVSAEQMQVSYVNLQLAPQLGFDSLLRQLEQQTSTPAKKHRPTRDFTENEERRTVMAVLKQSFIMGAISKEEYDHMVGVNLQTFMEMDNTPMQSPGFVSRGAAWLKKGIEKLDEALMPTTLDDVPIDVDESIPKAALLTPDTPAPPPFDRIHIANAQQSPPSSRKKPRRRKILEEEDLETPKSTDDYMVAAIERAFQDADFDDSDELDDVNDPPNVLDPLELKQ